MMNESIDEVGMNLKDYDMSQLSDVEVMQLTPFYLAYNKSHGTIFSRNDYKSMGVEPVDKAGCGMRDIQETLDAIDTLSTFHLNEQGEVVPGEGVRADWMERRISQWARK